MWLFNRQFNCHSAPDKSLTLFGQRKRVNCHSWRGCIYTHQEGIHCHSSRGYIVPHQVGTFSLIKRMYCHSSRLVHCHSSRGYIVPHQEGTLPLIKRVYCPSSRGCIVPHQEGDCHSSRGHTAMDRSRTKLYNMPCKL